MAINSNYITSDQWEVKANTVLSHFDYKQPDEIDIRDICFKYGIRIMPLDRPFVDNCFNYDSIKHLDSFSIPSTKGRRGTIFLSEHLDEITKKILLAEEFCHLYLHYCNQLTIDIHTIAKNEEQAKKMSAYLLMPKIFLKNVFNSALEQTILIQDIADYFVVSEEFSQYRLQLSYHHKIDALGTIQGHIGSVSWI